MSDFATSYLEDGWVKCDARLLSYIIGVTHKDSVTRGSSLIATAVTHCIDEQIVTGNKTVISARPRFG